MDQPAPTSTSSSWLEGRIVRVLWTSAETGYAVVKVATLDGEVTAVGTLAGVLDGATAGEEPFVALEGRYEDHAVHGRQFRASSYLLGQPRSLAGLVLWLSRVKGVGETLGRRIVDRFGFDTLQVLGDAGKLETVSGIGPAKAEAIAKQWREDEEGRATSILLRGLGLSARLTERIRRRYGDRTAWVVTREPYRLAEEISGVGFKLADQLARRQGLPEDDPARVRAAVLHVLDAESSEGHCFLRRQDVAREVGELGVPIDGVDAAIAAVADAGRAVLEYENEDVGILAPPSHPDDRIWSGDLWNAEQTVADDLRLRLHGAEAAAVDPAEVANAERWEGVTLDESQRAAVTQALAGGVVVITGGPGTGKTTLVRVLLRAVRERGAEFLLASPTGRAAKRLEEATGREASTIHRLLEFNPGAGGFQKNRGEPLAADGLVVDECSMVDLPLMAALLEALPPPPFSLVLVGDADQLPSVGPGQVLRDLIASGAVPVARLTRIHRQGAESRILDAARDIHDGRVPTSGDKADDDFFLLVRDDADRARDTIVQVAADRLPARGFDPMDDVQVLAPTRRGPLGTETLNKALQARLNPSGSPVTRGDREWRVGDRVLCTKNRYDVEVFNGDVGRVVAATKDGLDVRFDDRVVPWAWDELGMLELAYAVTVHKSQGSEYPAVVLALHPSHAIMLERNLFYTAVTRAKRFLCVVGSPRAWERAVRGEGRGRNTRLAERLRSS